MLRAVGSFADYFISPSITSVARWLALISVTSFFAGFIAGYLTGHRREIQNLVQSVRGELQATDDDMERELATL